MTKPLCGRPVCKGACDDCLDLADAAMRAPRFVGLAACANDATMPMPVEVIAPRPGNMLSAIAREARRRGVRFVDVLCERVAGGTT